MNSSFLVFSYLKLKEFKRKKKKKYKLIRLNTNVQNRNVQVIIRQFISVLILFPILSQ